MESVSDAKTRLKLEKYDYALLVNRNDLVSQFPSSIEIAPLSISQLVSIKEFEHAKFLGNKPEPVTEAIPRSIMLFDEVVDVYFRFHYEGLDEEKPFYLFRDAENRIQLEVIPNEFIDIQQKLADLPLLMGPTPHSIKTWLIEFFSNKSDTNFTILAARYMGVNSLELLVQQAKTKIIVVVGGDNLTQNIQNFVRFTNEYDLSLLPYSHYSFLSKNGFFARQQDLGTPDNQP